MENSQILDQIESNYARQTRRNRRQINLENRWLIERIVVPPGEARCQAATHPLKELGSYRVLGRNDTHKFIWTDGTVITAKDYEYTVLNIAGQAIRGDMSLMYHRRTHSAIIFWIFPEVKGFCTLGVARGIQAILHDHPDVRKGKVEISSSTPCAAFNCYDRAMKMNNFRLDRNQLEKLNKFLHYEKLTDDKPGILITWTKN